MNFYEIKLNMSDYNQEIKDLLQQLPSQEENIALLLSIEQTLKILERLAQIGKLTTTYQLFYLVYYHYEAIREKAVETIAAILKRNYHKNKLYRSIRHFGYQPKYFNFFTQIFDDEHLVTVLGIVSMNYDGYEREKAVKILGEIKQKDAIPFLIFRLSDWVRPVRESAKQAIRGYLTSEYITRFILHIDLVEDILKVNRVDLSDIHQEIIDFLTKEEHLNSVLYQISRLSQFRGEEKQKLIICKYLLEKHPLHPKVIKTFVTNRSCFIRLQIAKQSDKIELISQIKLLSMDKNWRVRLAALNSLKSLGQILITTKQVLLTDKAYVIRNWAQVELGNSDINLGDFYRKEIVKAEHLVASILGLGEVGEKEDIKILAPFLDYSNVDVCNSALIATVKLDEILVIENYLYQFLRSPSMKLRNTAIIYLVQIPDNDTLSKVRKIYNVGDVGTKTSILKLFNKIRGERGRLELLPALMDDNNSIRNIGKFYLNRRNRR